MSSLADLGLILIPTGLLLLIAAVVIWEWRIDRASWLFGAGLCVTTLGGLLVMT